MADTMIIPIAADIATHKFYLASAKSCRARFVDPEKWGQAAAFLRGRLAGAVASGSFGLRPRPMVLANAERAAA
ncbi:hypothetical protein MesoLjLc_68030 [Mesorhizobium sp. L-8-10]|nr:hypothetical protein MesoLjLc_68030 [Mesorhizobium sp. L-8-10]